ncbi:hypothetical protein, variant [Verruconis gallopava]|nr:hypothetical protein, variant [Verruconis gallopava]KIW03989.1 hypothetical protein, variant [Verruconis gallopava]
MAQLITKYFLDNYPAVKINGIVRNASKVPDNVRTLSSIGVFEADATDKSSLVEALKGSQVCICCYSGEPVLMTDGQKLLVDCCIEAGVSRYIASDWGNDFRALALGEVPMKDASKLIYSYLQGKRADGKDILGVHILTGTFMEVLFSHMFADDAHTVIKYFGTGDERFDVSAMPDAAAWTVEAVMDPNASGVIEVRGDRVCYNAIAKQLEEVYQTKITLQNCGTLDSLKSMIDRLRQKDPGNVKAWAPLLFVHYVLSGKGDLKNVDSTRYPKVDPLSLTGFLNQHTLADVTEYY